ncbi:TonB-dependent receptor [Labilibacter sediminis]|nr:TonB-dependent receptor [Labilibacter sediminis]
MEKLLKLFLSIFFLSITVWVQAQSVKGKVTSADSGEPIPGVSIVIKGTASGTVTDVDGNYQLLVDTDKTLVFSFVGMLSQEIPVTGKGMINVTLKNDIHNIEEVVAIGYGSMKKSDVTGSIVSVKGDDLKSNPSPDAMSGLQGKVSGMIVTNSGRAGDSPDVKIRGIGTVQAGTGPLYVVDGVFTNGISFLNPNDIESIEVLKDASSLAIFGAQGANGVIIVTTKTAEKGKLTVNYDGYAGIQTLHQRDRIDFTNASEFTMLYNEMLQNNASDLNQEYVPWTGDLTGEGTDWVDEVLRNALVTNHSISVSSNKERSTSLFSLGYFQQDGITKTDSYKRYTARFKQDYIVSDFLEIGANLIANNWYRTDYNPNILRRAREAVPTYAPYDNGDSDWDRLNSFPGNIGEKYTSPPDIQPNVGNPVAMYEILEGTGEYSGYTIIGSAYAKVNFTKDFSYKISGNATVSLGHNSNYNPHFAVGGIQKNEHSSFSRGTSRSKDYQVDHLFEYSKVTGEHRIKAIAGMTYRESENMGFSASRDSISAQAYADPSMWMLNAGYSEWDNNGDYKNEVAFTSYLGRVSYSYKDKYLANLTVRRDGSSKFGPDHRWGTFPAVGLGWVVSNEAFMQNVEKVDFLKIRASWGQAGNDKIGNYMYLPTINPQGESVVIDNEIIYIPTRSFYADPGIHWEIVEGVDIGAETSLFNNLLHIDIGYFNKTTKDLLATVPAPASSSAPYAVTNAGSLRNSGFESTATGHFKFGDFNLTLSGNASYLKNEVLELGNDNADIISNLHYRTVVGQSVGMMYGYIQEGIFQNQEEIDNSPVTAGVVRPGDMKYKDLNGDEKIDENDRTYIGNHLPDWTYGFSINAGYKNFDFLVDLNGVVGVDNYTEIRLPASWAVFNMPGVLLNRWHGEGTSNHDPILSARPDNALASTYFVESGDYMRIRNIQLGYSLPPNLLNNIGIQGMRIYVNAQNPITFQNYTGWTPEVGGNILTGGDDINYTNFPIGSTYTIGLNINF